MTRNPILILAALSALGLLILTCFIAKATGQYWLPPFTVICLTILWGNILR